MSDVVRERLEALLAEVRPRHALAVPDFVTGSAGALPSGVAAPSSEPPGQVGGAEQAAARGAPVTGTRALAGQAGHRVAEFTREHLAAVVVVLLVGCGWTTYSLLQARSTPVAIAPAPSVVASPAPSPTPTPDVLVHVLGAVHQPGLVELPQGGRVADAIALAGGLTASADPGELNLAAVVADGAQLVIGTRRKPGGELRGDAGQAGSGSSSASVSLNTATIQQLDTLPGVGPVTAQKIIDWRQKHGRFNSVTELQEVDGIGPKTYADLAPNVRV